MPLERDYPKERLAFMLEDAGVRHLLTRTSLLPVLPEFRGDALLLDQAGPMLDAQDEHCPDSGAGPESLAYLMYTSGSTGRPKGVQILHRGVNRLILANDYADLGPDATLLAAQAKGSP